ncbi:MAG TPA: hypothetical protein VFZ66_05195 [Herpetosiphonaceae bacterium]
MQIYRVFRLIIVGLLSSLLAACANELPPALPTPTVAPRAVVVPITSVLAEPQRWSGQTITVVAPTMVKNDDRVLMSALADSPVSSPGQAQQMIWLAEPPPDAIRSQLTDGTGVLKVRGQLSPPGAYGREQRFPYQISPESVEVLQPERTTLVNLVQNPRALDRILLTVEGTLLAQQSSALLVDKVSEGGVPVGLNQIKLPYATIDQALLDRLKRSGEVRWGAVHVIGWWQDGTLTPFKITLAESP